MAVAQPKICSNYQRDRFEHAGAAGGFIDSYGFPFCSGRMLHVFEKDHGQYDDLRDIFWPSGAAFFIKQPYWELFGVLDVALFANVEKINLCWRLHQADSRYGDVA